MLQPPPPPHNCELPPSPPLLQHAHAIITVCLQWQLLTALACQRRSSPACSCQQCKASPAQKCSHSVSVCAVSCLSLYTRLLCMLVCKAALEIVLLARNNGVKPDLSSSCSGCLFCMVQNVGCRGQHGCGAVKKCIRTCLALYWGLTVSQEACHSSLDCHRRTGPLRPALSCFHRSPMMIHTFASFNPQTC